ncbi:MAG: hypothetical protein KJ804_16070 [Proteobacteria bacterium]|nr:hypothetical protein [Pseudomonadota bacterium]MBU1059828.1 hypothetical protein [Pseudomonadota bacterium]
MKKKTLAERLELYVMVEGSKKHSSSKLLLASSAVVSVGTILIPPPAEAAIVYSGVQNKVVSAGQGPQQVDFNGDGVFEFTFKLSAFAPYTYSQKLAVTGTAAKVIESEGKPSRLNGNYTISSQRLFASVNNDDLAVGGTSAATGGNFLGAQGYLGVTFEIDSNSHYGWIQYKANNDASVGTIIDWAYEDTPGKAIKTPKKFNWNLFLPAMTAGRKIK